MVTDHKQQAIRERRVPSRHLKNTGVLFDLQSTTRNSSFHTAISLEWCIKRKQLCSSTVQVFFVGILIENDEKLTNLIS